jgi:hypothetical protein
MAAVVGTVDDCEWTGPTADLPIWCQRFGRVWPTRPPPWTPPANRERWRANTMATPRACERAARATAPCDAVCCDAGPDAASTTVVVSWTGEFAPDQCHC